MSGGLTRRRVALACRWRLAAVALLCVALPRAARAQDQDVECGAPEDREVRALTFQGNHAFTSRDLALRVATTPSDWQRRVLRVFGTRHCLDSDVLRLDVGRLRAFYRRHGYYGAAVDTSVVAQEDGGVRVAFVIREGEPIRIDPLRISGLDSTTAPIANTGDLEIRQGGVFDLTVIQATIDSIKSRLRNRGFPRADVAASYLPDTVTHRADVGLTVIAGSRAKIGAIHLSSEPVPGQATRLGDPTLRRLLPLREGDGYNAQAVSDAQRTLYQSALFRKVDIRLAADSLQPAGDTLVDLDVQLAEDYMRQIDTEIGWAELDCFKDRTHYVDKNFLGAARRLDLTAQISKVGYGRPTRVGNGSLCAPKIRADTFSTQLNYYAGATVRLPTLFGLRASPSLSLYTERRSEYNAYSRLTKVGGEASLVREIASDLPLRLAYSLEYGHTNAQPAVICALFRRCTSEDRDFLTQDRPLGVLSAHVDRIRLDNPANPHSGTAMRYELRGAAKELGSSTDIQFVKGFGDIAMYRQLRSSLVLAMRARAGTVLGRSLSLNDATGFIPPEERLYAGGATSVRGYGQNELGDVLYLLKADQAPLRTAGAGDTVFFTVDPTHTSLSSTIPVGGTSLVVLNFELRLRSPFYSDLLEFSTFADAGDVWQRGVNPTAHRGSLLYLNGLKWTPGFGVKIFTAVGPIQANVAYNPFLQPAGALYFIQAPATRLDASGRQETSLISPLYCVSPGNSIPAVPTAASFQYEQVSGRDCPASFVPPPDNSFRKHLALSLSFGPDF